VLPAGRPAAPMPPPPAPSRPLRPPSSRKRLRANAVSEDSELEDASGGFTGSGERHGREV
jgi:hypothetical protein